MNRVDDLARFYELLDQLASDLGGPARLVDCHGRMDWPERGVYFFFEANESRSDSGTGPRVVRVGTHALTEKSRTTLWNRLSQHRGTRALGGNHRGSIFRLLVGTALMQRDTALSCLSWGMGSSAPRQTRDMETHVERAVSEHIGQMPFLWLAVDDPPGGNSLRGHIERNAIALLSNREKAPLDPPSPAWLGLDCPREKVRTSGLWNQNHVDEAYDPTFLDTLEDLI